MKMLIRTATASCALLLTLFSPTTLADEEVTDNRIFLTVEAMLGGSTLATVEFEDGDVDRIRAGSGIYLGLGAAHLMFDKHMDVGVRAGYLFDLITAKNDAGDESVLSFTRWPLDVFSHYWIDRHCLGGGLTMHFDPKFSSRETTDDAKYHDALGIYGEYLYHFVGTDSALGVKYLNIDYKDKETGEVTNGSGWGMTFTQSF